ncbi:acyl-CoA dehydrogenase family protein [Spongiibacter sp. UBA1325]|jgi:alkylation response protein AidB-like acyl-CoA dehydrogenase|uniref:acyl-CoA dehydrogenase family protein n=1 Tax=Spongiibacter sp. UBA1325 TaxID=1947543 RepID=UPI00257A040A|nr:acyl-CoA dehydrogenase family protein [Spongiibacter sp. UBA1325]|tara:strand:- start:12906 stop:14042 length:1137 start_codon:yes stop_codon:yes gene_type:complete
MLARSAFNEDHALFRDSVKKMYAKHLIPHVDQWEEDGIVSRDFWRACGENGMLLPDIPQEYGGSGLDFKFNAIILEETAMAGTTGPAFGVHNDIVAHYLFNYGSESAKRQWLPKMASGEAIGAICMSEPSTGSDLKAIRTTATPVEGGFRINGAKTFITNGINADVAVIAARVGNDSGSKSISLFVSGSDEPGFFKSRKLDKVGNRSSDTAELFFDDLFIPTENLLGQQGEGFSYMMKELPQERLSIAISCQAAAQHAYDVAVAYVKERRAFGKAVFDFQNTRFVLANLKAQLQVGWTHLDACIQALVDKQLTTDEAAAAKLWHSELRCNVVDDCLQLFGGYGYVEEYEIARLWRDARVMRLYGGTSEIMKDLISRSI